MLAGAVGHDADVIHRLRTQLQPLSHPAVLPTQIVRDPTTGRATLLSDVPELSLRDRFQECVARAMPGIPRPELLDHLYEAAAALDQLQTRHGLCHLALTPRRLLLGRGGILLAGFGQEQLIWPSAPQGAGRYTAPELVQGNGSPASDLYSLALIYAEMLTGIHPCPRRSVSRRETFSLELSLLPAPDRPVVAQALNLDPRGRWASCSDFVAALEEAYAANSVP
jgi:serine/threonine protein kinase